MQKNLRSSEKNYIFALNFREIDDLWRIKKWYALRYGR